MKKIILSACVFIAGITLIRAQEWPYNSLINGSTGNILGTSSSFPINIFTNNNNIARFTTGSSLASWSGNFGDGLRILAPAGSAGNLDLFTSNSNGANETHAVFGASGQVSGQNDRFEFISTGASLGNYYSTFSGGGIHRFDRGQTEYGRLGTNNF